MCPEAAEVVEPGVDFAQGGGVEGVDAAGAVDADVGEARVAEDFEVLGDGGLADAELALDERDDLPGGVLAAGEKLEDAAADGIAEDVEGVHHISGGGASPV